MRTIAGVRIPDTRHVPEISAIQVHDLSSRIEDIAQRVALIPDTPLTAQQRRSLHCIARELIRRANGPTFDERS